MEWCFTQVVATRAMLRPVTCSKKENCLEIKAKLKIIKLTSHKSDKMAKKPVPEMELMD